MLETTKILIVEDDDDNRQILIDLLSNNGYAAIATDDPIQALRLWRGHHPDLMLVDIQLDDVTGTSWFQAKQQCSRMSS